MMVSWLRFASFAISYNLTAVVDILDVSITSEGAKVCYVLVVQ